MAALVGSSGAAAAPRVPADDGEVLETLPLRRGDPAEREMRALRQQLAADPRNVELAVGLARRYYERASAEGDPRYVGYAQAALAPWWDAASPPPAVRVQRAVLRQFSHGFDAARADLEAVVAVEPDNGEAWAWLAAIALVQTRYADARAACPRMGKDASPLIVAACMAQVDALAGRARPALAALRAALREHGDVSAAERLWALTRLAEIEVRLGEHAAAETSFRAAQALGLDDVYLLAAHADFLLDRGRPRDVLTLLRGRERSDLLLLRLALAARAAGLPEQAARGAELKARFDAARRRGGDSVHEKEEARYLLAFGGDRERALALAADNYRVQREPADARVLLEAALAARRPAAAAPALRWMAESGIESVVLQGLAAQLKALS